MPLDQVELDENYEIKQVKEMSFFDHIDDLRGHLIRSVAVILVLTIAFFTQKDFLFQGILYAPRDPNFVTYRFFCWVGTKINLTGICITPPPFTTFTTSLGEAFFTHMKMAFMAGIIVGMPYILWEVWRFIRPGLFEKEIKTVRGIVGVTSALFLTGVLFGYFVIAPMAISFLAGYTIEGTTVQTTLDSYIGYMIMFTLPIGLVFELPVLIYFFAKLGLVTAQFLKTYRRHMAAILVLIAGIITPSPDVFTQLLVSIPLYGLYEVSIHVAKRVELNRLAEQKRELNRG
ncbi:MAG: hypothetical protein RL757_2421 [Bacteroidota bacterium]|jgi:sec-independent protein translocase protein TatC